MIKRRITPIFALFLLVSCGKFLDKNAGKERTSGTTIIETGTLEAINVVPFLLQQYTLYWSSMQIIWIAEHGSKVKEGDVVIQLDPAEVNRLILERETNLETQLANYEKMKVTQSNQIKELESRIVNETASFNLKKIEMEASLFETERHRAIKKLEFKQAEITLAKEKRKLELAKMIQEVDTKVQQIRLQQIKNEIIRFYQVLPQLNIKSPITGVFQRGRTWSNQMVKPGDRVYPSTNMGNIPELRWMRVSTFISESDFLKIDMGQKVVVRLDALPKVKFNGEVTFIGKFCREKEKNSRQKGFDVEITMLDSDERLKPGMTVSCEYLYQ